MDTITGMLNSINVHDYNSNWTDLLRIRSTDFSNPDEIITCIEALHEWRLNKEFEASSILEINIEHAFEKIVDIDPYTQWDMYLEVSKLIINNLYHLCK